MGKKLITKQDVQRWYFEGVKEIYVDNDTIILPGAKDDLMNAGIKVKPQKQEEILREKIKECCDEKDIDESLKEKIISTVIAKYTGGEV